MKHSFKGLVERILVWEAKAVLKKYKPKIVAVTGTVGKTSTKDALYAVLSSEFSTRRSEKSYNNRMGIALTVLGSTSGYSNPIIWIKNVLEGLLHIILPYTYPKWLVLEIATCEPGDIKDITSWIKPNITVITRFADVPVHIEFFPSIDDLIREKGYLAEALTLDGVLVFNNDDMRVRDFAEIIQRKKVTYGFELGAHVEGSHDAVAYGRYDNSDIEFPMGISFKINYQGSSIPLTLTGALGKQHMYPLLAAFAVGSSLGIHAIKISEALKTYVSPKGRMRLLPGIKDTLIIDDTYNSSPIAVEEALKTLKQIKAMGRKIAMLGDMLELGSYSIDEHKRIGEMASKFADMLVAVGVRSRATVDAALDAGMNENNILQFESSQEAGKYLESVMKAGDIILIKGSQATRMEKAVKEIMRYPQNAETLLVRQDQSWLGKK